jgi:hypothetical protein
MISAGAPAGNDHVKVQSIYRSGLTMLQPATYRQAMSSTPTTSLAFLERALLAVTNHCVADILCSR